MGDRLDMRGVRAFRATRRVNDSLRFDTKETVFRVIFSAIEIRTQGKALIPVIY